MIFTQSLPFITEFVEELDQGIRKRAPNRKLSTIQRYWLSFCLMGILLCNSVCWAAFARAGLGGYSQAALSWMFRQSKILWPLLLNVTRLSSFFTLTEIRAYGSGRTGYCSILQRRCRFQSTQVSAVHVFS